MDDRLTSILRRYSHGEISAERAADEMGPPTTSPTFTCYREKPGCHCRTVNRRGVRAPIGTITS
jgi:hypothetical protein